MKTKIKLLRTGCSGRPTWKLIVQGEKKNLKGKYIEHVGTWRPRHTKTVQRGILINKHKLRYWLGVGAQPTNGVIRVLHKFGGFFPKVPIPFGSSTTYEKPKVKQTYIELANYWKKRRNTHKYK